MKKEYSCKIEQVQHIHEDTVYITIGCQQIADNAVPGQFVNMSCSYFLKRPFGIASVDKEKGTFDIGVKIVGKGTADIASFSAGQTVSVLGPLGNGFDLSSSDKFILVAGGTGVFPINFAHEILAQRGVRHVVVEGFRNKQQITMCSPEYVLTTDDGSAGIHGNCCTGLDTLIESEIEGATVLCVGPLPMMKAVGAWATGNGLKCYVSMEQRMACGIGICLVCVCKVKAEEQGQEFNHVRCCKDGPVFPYEEVVW